jgi:spermidine synthase
MGTTLPVLSFFLFSRDMGRGRALGILYGVNTLGAFAGSIAGGFFLMAYAGVSGAIRIAALINIAAAIAAYAVSLRSEAAVSDDNGGGSGEVMQTALKDETSSVAAAASSDVRSGFEAWLVVFVFVSGFVSLGYEIIWARVFSMFLKNAPHAFAAVVASYLAAVGAGALLYSRLTESVAEDGKKLYFTLINLASIISVYAGYVFLYDIYEAGSDAASYGALYSGYLWAIFKSTMTAVFPAAFFMGMTLPAAIELIIARFARGATASAASSAAAKLYSLNTLGAILGTAATGFYIIPRAGINGALSFFLAFSAAVNLVLSFYVNFSSGGRKAALLLVNIAVMAGAFGLADTSFLIAESRMREIYPDGEFIYYKDDAVASVGVSKNGALFVDARPMTIKVSVLKLMAHLPLALAENNSRMLIICLGEGMTLKSAMLHENLKCDAVELSGGVIDAYKKIFSAGSPLKSGFNLIEDDGRGFVQFCRDKYDVITIDPPPPLYGSGAINFHTREFYARARQILNDGGVICQWFPFQTDSETYLMALKSFAAEFPECLAWSVPENVGVLMLGRKGAGKLKIDMNKFASALKKTLIAADIAEFARPAVREYISNPFYLVSLIKGDGASILKKSEGLGCVTDDLPYLEFSYKKYCAELDAAFALSGRKYIQHAALIETPEFKVLERIDNFEAALKASPDEISARFAKSVSGGGR